MTNLTAVISGLKEEATQYVKSKVRYTKTAACSAEHAMETGEGITRFCQGVIDKRTIIGKFEDQSDKFLPAQADNDFYLSGRAFAELFKEVDQAFMEGISDGSKNESVQRQNRAYQQGYALGQSAGAYVFSLLW